MAKKHFFGQKFLWQANKNCFKLKMPKFLGNHVIIDIDTLYYYTSAESKRTTKWQPKFQNDWYRAYLKLGKKFTNENSEIQLWGYAY